MVELLLNGNRMVLAKKFDDTFIEENPFLTKNGEYTLDIELNLKIASNAKFFGHINRFNVSKIKLISSAILIVDNLVRLNGTAAIISVNETSVSIQLLSGNSELNFICDSELRMKSYDFGSEPALDFTHEHDSFNIIYPERNYVCAWNVISGKVFNAIQASWYYDNEDLAFRWVWAAGYQNSGFNLQPFLQYYVVQVIGKLGYTIEENVLATDELWKRLIVFAPSSSLNYVDYLPDWTVLEFLERIEKLGNVIFVVDKVKKSVRILRTKSYYDTAMTHFIKKEDIFDEYNSEVDDNTFETLNYKKVKYNLDSTEYFKYQCLSDDVIKYATTETYADFPALVAKYPDQAALLAQYNTLKLFYITQTDNHYIVEKKKDNSYKFKLVNIYKERNTGAEADDFTELDIVPVELVNFHAYLSEQVLTSSSVALTDINVLIKDGSALEVGSTSKMKVGIQFGLARLNVYDLQGDSTIQSNIVLNDWYKLNPTTVEVAILPENMRMGLRIGGQYGLYNRNFKDNLNIDGSSKWTIIFRWKPEYDVRNYFVFSGKKFFCEKIETKGDAENNGGFVTGYFYGVLDA